MKSRTARMNTKKNTKRGEEEGHLDLKFKKTKEIFYTLLTITEILFFSAAKVTPVHPL